MLDQIMSHKASINEIRTERLSKAICAMSSRPILDLTNDSRIDGVKFKLERSYSINTLDTVDSIFRSRSTSSLARQQRFRSLRINSNMGDKWAYATLDVRHLIPEQKEDKRSRAVTVCRISSKLMNGSKSPSPLRRNRSETEPSKIVDQNKMRKISHQICARSLSPFNVGMFGQMSNDSQSPQAPNSPGYGTQHIVLVVGSKNVGKSALIDRFTRADLKKSACDLNRMMDENCANVLVDNEEIQLRFVEVNNQKNDLWLSLSCAAYVILYNFDDISSFRNAVDVVARIRERQDTIAKPIMLVSNKQSNDRKRFTITNDDGRQVSKQKHCQFYEIYVSAGRSVLDLLTGIAFEIRRHQSIDPVSIDGMCSNLGTNSAPFHSRTSSGGSTASSTASKTSSRSSISLKLWPKRKGKGKGADSFEGGIVSSPDASVINGLRSYLFGERRGSRSLDGLSGFVK